MGMFLAEDLQSFGRWTPPEAGCYAWRDGASVRGAPAHKGAQRHRLLRGGFQSGSVL